MVKIKVCGMKYPENIREILALPINYIGFIFYEQSPRYVGNLNISSIDFPSGIKKVGVFINDDIKKILSAVKNYSLDYVQLHGNESPAYCRTLVDEGCKIMKVFSVSDRSDLLLSTLYEDICDFFLFDTKTPLYGGSGQHFDWSVLDSYHGNTPFFLSGGISLEDMEQVRHLKYKQLYAIDLNSRFEIEAGRKNVNLLRKVFEI